MPKSCKRWKNGEQRKQQLLKGYIPFHLPTFLSAQLKPRAMSEPKLLRRPLPPKVETERLTPKRKSYKGTLKEDEELLRRFGTDDTYLPLTPVKSQQPIYLCFPDYDLGTELPGLMNRSCAIPPQFSGPPRFPSQKSPIPSRFRISALRPHPLDFASGFMLQGLTIVTCLPPKFPRSVAKKPILSRCNYEVLTSQLIAEERRGPQQVNTLLFSYEDLPYVGQRKPERQMLLEKMLEQKILFGEEESVLGEDEEQGVLGRRKSFLVGEQKEKKKKRVTYAPESGHDLDFSASIVSGTAYKPKLRSEDEESQLMAKAETAVLGCLMHEKTGLSLKAFFLTRLPDLSPLADFLLYLNLSFNFLYFFPQEVFCLKHLEILKLRNNPIRFIPEEISQMKSLKYLVMSFNLLTTLPPGLFTLTNLEGLDISYNEFESIPNEIGNLSKLTYLSLEGNLLYVLPCGVLKLQLSCLKVENNFLHPYFWNDICKLEPQRLTDMAAHCFAKHSLWEIYHEIPADIQEILCNSTVCDCCTGLLYGKGLRFIYIYKNNYGLRLPYLFRACSPNCYRDYIAAASSG
nr:leucine-rich repeat-containing protein 63 [Pogona vitticeps]